jgi:hypothetical protein
MSREGCSLSRFPELLRRLFHYYGFEPIPQAQGALKLRKGSLTVELVPVEGAAEIDELALAQILGVERKSDRVIVASLGRFTEEARLLAIGKKVQLWDRTHLEEEVGRMVMGEVDSRPAAVVDDSLLEPFLSGNAGKLFAGDGANDKHDPDGNAAQTEVMGSSTGGPPEGQTPGKGMDIPDGEATVQPQITLEQVRSLVSERLEGAFRYDMQLMPHYSFSYYLEMDAPGGARERRSGGVLVNAISGESSVWRPAGTMEKLEPGKPRMEPSLERSEAARKAVDHVISTNTRVVNLKDEKRSVTVYEKRTIRPTEEAIRLDHRGMLFLPVWCVEGANGAAVLDAITGRVIKEEFFDAPTTTLEKDHGS